MKIMFSGRYLDIGVEAMMTASACSYKRAMVLACRETTGMTGRRRDDSSRL